MAPTQLLIETPLGPLPYREEQLLTAEAGLIGLPHATRFILVEHPDIEPLRWLVSVNDGQSLSLPVIDARLLIPDYRLELTLEQQKRLGLDASAAGILPLAITLITEPADQSTANLKAPVVVNTAQMTAAQVVLSDSPYNVSHPLVCADEPNG